MLKPQWLFWPAAARKKTFFLAAAGDSGLDARRLRQRMNYCNSFDVAASPQHQTKKKSSSMLPQARRLLRGKLAPHTISAEVASARNRQWRSVC
jgi:hypothetical protein